MLFASLDIPPWNEWHGMFFLMGVTWLVGGIYALIWLRPGERRTTAAIAGVVVIACGALGVAYNWLVPGFFAIAAGLILVLAGFLRRR